MTIRQIGRIIIKKIIRFLFMMFTIVAIALLASCNNKEKVKDVCEVQIDGSMECN